MQQTIRLKACFKQECHLICVVNKLPRSLMYDPTFDSCGTSVTDNLLSVEGLYVLLVTDIFSTNWILLILDMRLCIQNRNAKPMKKIIC